MTDLKIEYPKYKDGIISEPLITNVQRRVLLAFTLVYSFFSWWLALSITLVLLIRYTFKLFNSKWLPRILKFIFFIFAFVGQLIIIDLLFGDVSWSITYVLPIIVNMTSLIMIVYALSKGKHWKPLIPIQFFNFWTVIFLLFSNYEKNMPLIYSAIIMILLTYLVSIIFYGRLFINELKKYLHL